MNTLLTLHDPAPAREYYDYGHWRALTMYSLAAEHAAAFAVPDDRLEERVCLAIIAREGQAPAAEGMLSHLNRAGLSGYDIGDLLGDGCVSAHGLGQDPQARAGAMGGRRQDQTTGMPLGACEKGERLNHGN